LAQTLVSPDPAVRMAALRSLVEAPSPQSGRLLAVALVDPDANVRRTAAEVAGKLKAEEAVFCLILALDDASAEVRQAAEQAIAAVTGREVAGGTSPDERRARVSELKQWWKDQRYGQLSRGGAGQDP
jgi:HEAT repeat protein